MTVLVSDHSRISVLVVGIMHLYVCREFLSEV